MDADRRRGTVGIVAALIVVTNMQHRVGHTLGDMHFTNRSSLAIRLELFSGRRNSSATIVIRRR